MGVNQYAQNSHRAIQFISLFIFLLVTGCGSIQIGRDFDVEAFEKMAKVGETSKTQVRQVLGSAKSSGISINRDGERLVEWVYFYVTGKVSEMESTSLKILQVRFDLTGKLRSYSWSGSVK